MLHVVSAVGIGLLLVGAVQETGPSLAATAVVACHSQDERGIGLVAAASRRVGRQVARRVLLRARLGGREEGRRGLPRVARLRVPALHSQGDRGLLAYTSNRLLSLYVCCSLAL